MTTLLERLKTDILVADGAMGTMLYQQGLKHCYESYNLANPEAVKEIHKAYIEAGADIIQTNTYGAKRHQLRGYGLEDRVKEINQAGAYLAREVAGERTFVLGTLGASRGVRQCELSLDEIVAETLEQANDLLETGVLDGILLETYYDDAELLAVVEAIRAITDLPLVVNMTLHEVGVTESGKSVLEVFDQLVALEVDVIGFNCYLGPYHMLQTLEQVPLVETTYLSVYPNASLVTLDTAGKKGYQFASNADYFGQTAVRFAQAGARLIGGCCGTTPEHIRAAKQALREVKPVEEKQVRPLPLIEDRHLSKARQTESIVDKVKREVTVIAELDPPRTLDLTGFMEGVAAVEQSSIAAITLADNSLARTRVCNLSVASLLKPVVKTPLILHLACRDHNMIGLQSRLMGMDVLDFTDVLVITGDPSKMGNFPGASSVYDVTSLKLMKMIKGLNNGQGYTGSSIRKPTRFTVAAAFNPNHQPLAEASRLIEQKIEAGADYFITQPIFDKSLIKPLAELTKPYATPFFVGIMPITSYTNAMFIHNEVPGIDLSSEFLAALEAVKDDPERSLEIALAESKAVIREALTYFNGIYLVTPFMRYDLVLQLNEYVEDVRRELGK